MSKKIYEQYVDERGNTSVRISDEFVVLTHDEAELIKAKFDQLKAESTKLRELVRGLKYCAHEAYGMCARVPVGGERPFTCCPLYDFDAKKYRCEEFMLELGIEVGE